MSGTDRKGSWGTQMSTYQLFEDAQRERMDELNEQLTEELQGWVAECEACDEPIPARWGYGALCASCEQDEDL